MLPASYSLPAALILLATGALACVAGHRLFRLVLGLFGFVLGALLATSFLAPTETPTTLIAVIAGGAVGAAILLVGYFVGVAFAGAALAAILVHLVWSRVGGEPHAVAIVVACIVGAFVSLTLQRWVIVLGSAYGGAWTMLVGALMLLGRRGVGGAVTTGDPWMAYPLNPAPGELWVWGVWLVVGTIGAIVQLRWTSRPRRKGGGRLLRARRAA